MKKILFGSIVFITLSILLPSDAQWKEDYDNSQDDYTDTTSSPKADQWVITYGGSGNDRANSIRETSDGGYILSGPTASFGAGGYDAWVLKLTSEGDIEWQKTYGGSENDGGGIQETSDGGYVIYGETESFGAGDGDVWILKLTSFGDIEWQKTYGGGKREIISSSLQTSDGGYIVGCLTESFGAGDGDVWILKLTSSGDIEWQKTYGGDNWDTLESTWQTRDGGVVVAGITESYGAGDGDLWVLKLTSEGNIAWQRAYGGDKMDFPSSIVQTRDGGYVLSGGTNSFGAGGTDGWALKLTSKGNIKWQKTFGGYEGDWNSAIHETSDGGLILAGIIDEPLSSGNDDFSFLKLTSSGDIPNCAIVRNSNASVSDTFVSPADTSVIPRDTNVVPQNTDILPQESDATQKLLCTASVPLPKAPNRLKANAISWKKIKLRWNDKSKNEEGFFIERRSASDGTWEVIKKVKRNTKTCYDRGLTADTLYYYRVCAFDKNGYSAYSNRTKARTNKR